VSIGDLADQCYTSECVSPERMHDSEHGDVMEDASGVAASGVDSPSTEPL
jgi:hypothetical protein